MEDAEALIAALIGGKKPLHDEIDLWASICD
jgi:hypothetical protein